MTRRVSYNTNAHLKKETTISWRYNSSGGVPAKTKSQTQRNTITLWFTAMAMAALGRMNMSWLRIVYWVNIYSNVAIAVLKIGTSLHLHHTNTLLSRCWVFFLTLNIFVITFQQEIRAVSLVTEIVWIPEPTSWTSEVAVAQCISHFICCYISRYLLSPRRQEIQIGWRKHPIMITKTCKWEKGSADSPETPVWRLRRQLKRRGRIQQSERIMHRRD